MTFPKHYSVKTIFGDFGPITIKDLVNEYNTRLDKARLGKGYHLNADSVRQYLRKGNTLGHFRNMVFTECYGKLKGKEA